MKNRRITAVVLCSILLLGGCQSQETAKQEPESQDAAEEVQEDMGSADASEGAESAAGPGQTPGNADNTDSTEGAVVIEMGPEKEVWQDGNLICTFRNFCLYEKPEDAAISPGDMETADAGYYMDRSKFLMMEAEINNIDYKGSDDESFNVSLFLIAPRGGEEYAGWSGSYPAYVSEAGKGETNYYHVFVGEGETKTVKIGYYVPVKDADELRSACQLAVGEQYFEIPEME